MKLSRPASFTFVVLSIIGLLLITNFRSTSYSQDLVQFAKGLEVLPLINENHYAQAHHVLAHPKPFRFYVYESLNETYTASYIEKVLSKRLGRDSNCGWSLKVCTEKQHSNWRYTSWRHNSNADVAIANLFETYPYPDERECVTSSFAIRTADPNTANVFVVPYPHNSHCKTFARRTHCSERMGKRMNKNKTFFAKQYEELMASLTYLNETTRARHLFITSTPYTYSNERIVEFPFKTTLGGKLYRYGSTVGCKDKFPCGNIVVPYMNAADEYQPSTILSRNESWWVSRDRPYSVAALFGAINNDGKGWRHEIMGHWDSIFGSHVGGLPVQQQIKTGRRALVGESDAFEIYRNSTFCLILPGDGPPQKRFFDVIMSGCIPVVLSFQSKNDKMYPSWWKLPRMDAPIRISYPFAKGIFNDEVGIDYQSFVVELDPYRTDLMKTRLEAIMNNTTELHSLRRNLWHHAALFSYGLEGDSHRYFDAFAVILTQMGHYVERLEQ